MIALAFVAGITMYFCLGMLMAQYVLTGAWPLALGALAIAGTTFLYALRRI